MFLMQFKCGGRGDDGWGLGSLVTRLTFAIAGSFATFAKIKSCDN